MRLRVSSGLLDSLEISSWFSERFDGGDAILTVNPGSGGLEAQDWTEMLYRMYTRYAENKGLEGSRSSTWCPARA